ncbi:MAG: hypothetical protein ACFE9S_07650 [Candidatus Hermodarchaeota archaeon]
MSDLTTVELYKLEKYEIEKDPHILVKNGYLKIKVKNPEQNEGKYIRNLIPTSIQSNFINKIEEIEAEGKPVRIWCPKPRQVKITTITQALIYAKTTQQKGISSFIIANDSKGVNYIFDMAKRHQYYLEKEYPHLAPKKERSNKIELNFPSIQSAIYVDSSGNVAAGQKYSFQYVHLSEIPLYEHAEEMFVGLMQAVPNYPNTMVIGEGAAQGTGNFFHRECMKAYNNESDWEIFFPAFFEEPEYSLNMNEDQIRYLEKTLTFEEERLIDVYNITLNQLWWRRWCIINQCQGRNIADEPKRFYLPDLAVQSSLDNFHQFYPTCVLEAFVASGRCRFERSVLQEWMTGAPRERREDEDLELGKNYIIGYFELDNKGNVIFIEQSDGPWKVFELPKYGVDYAIGVDVASGAEIEEHTGKYDYSVIEGLRRDTLEQIIEYVNHIDPDLLAEQCWLAARAYGNPMLGIERNMDGGTVLSALRNKFNYNNLYAREVLDEKTRRRTKQLGWYTSVKTRPVLINDMATFIRERHGIFYSERLISECQTFIKAPDGKVEADVGTHDDTVVAMGIALQMHLLTPKSEAWLCRKKLEISYRK